MDNKTYTEKVCKAYANIENPRLKELIKQFILHLHSFIVETKVTEKEWELILQSVLKVAEVSISKKRNEFLLLADVLGASQLVERVNSHRSKEMVGSALLGPFYRTNAPMYDFGQAIMGDEEQGDRVIIEGKVLDVDAKPIAGAILDIWQAANNGFYDVQDPNQAAYNLRGKFTSQEDGSFKLVALVPTAYSVPVDGAAGSLLRKAKRQIKRPAHIHFIISAPRFKTLVTQVFINNDDLVENDVVFTADNRMLGRFVKKDDHYSLRYDFQLLPGDSMLPEATIE